MGSVEIEGGGGGGKGRVVKLCSTGYFYAEVVGILG